MLWCLLVLFVENNVSCCAYWQVKLPLKLRLKLISMMSLSTHMTTSKGQMNVQWMTRDLHRKTIWVMTNKCMVAVADPPPPAPTVHRYWPFWSPKLRKFYAEGHNPFPTPCPSSSTTSPSTNDFWIRHCMVDRSCIHALNVGNVICHRAVSLSTSIFTRVNTSAQSVVNVFSVLVN